MEHQYKRLRITTNLKIISKSFSQYASLVYQYSTEDAYCEKHLLIYF